MRVGQAMLEPFSLVPCLGRRDPRSLALRSQLARVARALGENLGREVLALLHRDSIPLVGVRHSGGMLAQADVL